MNKLVEFEGQKQLPAAVETIASDNPPDLVVIRGLVQSADTLDLLAQRGAFIEPLQLEVLYREIPEFGDANKIIAQRWREIGYPNMDAVGTAELGITRETPSRPHIDSPNAWEQFEAITLASLCTRGRRRFGAEVLPNQHRDADGNFDYDLFEEFNRPRSDFRQSIINDNRQPRTKTVVNAGDLVLFPHHPNITLHSVEHMDNDPAMARLLMWYASRSPIDA